MIITKKKNSQPLKGICKRIFFLLFSNNVENRITDDFHVSIRLDDKRVILLIKKLYTFRSKFPPKLWYKLF